MVTNALCLHVHQHDIRPDAVARSVEYPLRRQAVPRSTLASGTLFRGKDFFFPLIQEEQVISYCPKNGYSILVIWRLAEEQCG